MLPDKFRHQLRHELEVWRAEGLIDDSQHEQLAERYQFNTLDTVARNRFIMILLGLGSILIGLGVITFVAANWQELPRSAKVTLLLSLFIGVNIAGFYLWRRYDEAQQRLGHGLLILGALILGANMGLMGQMFHISRPFYELLLAWGIGVVAMAYSLRLTSLGVLSILLVWLGYWGFWQNFVPQRWSSLFLVEEFSWLFFLGEHMPLLICLMFIPLAYWCRSRWIFALAAIALVFSLEGNVLMLNLPAVSAQSMAWMLAITFTLPAALLWGYDDSLWVYGNLFQQSNLRRDRQDVAAMSSFQPIAQNTALFFLGIVFLIASFSEFWNNLAFTSSEARSPVLSWLPLLDILLLSALAIVEWLRLALLVRQRFNQSNLTTIVIGVLLFISALLPFWHLSVAPIPVVATFMFNVMLFLLAAGLIREGLAQGERRAFWSGMVLLTLRILTWFLLSATGLAFKSLVFILCGVGVIAIGLWFERYVRTLSNKPSRHSSQSPLS